jgi:predicted lactoylglutathione lyase
MVISEHIYAMLLTHAKFKEFTKKAIADARTTTEVLTALTVEGREEVDAMVGRALDAGGSPAREPQDHGFMYERSFEDLDGHIWEIVWMDPKAIQDQ